MNRTVKGHLLIAVLVLVLLAFLEPFSFYDRINQQGLLAKFADPEVQAVMLEGNRLIDVYCLNRNTFVAETEAGRYLLEVRTTKHYTETRSYSMHLVEGMYVRRVTWMDNLIPMLLGSSAFAVAAVVVMLRRKSSQF